MHLVKLVVPTQSPQCEFGHKTLSPLYQWTIGDWLHAKRDPLKTIQHRAATARQAHPFYENY